MCAGAERTDGLDTVKGLVRTFIYMNKTTTPNRRLHHLTSIFAVLVGRSAVPMRSLATKFLAVTAIVVAGATALAPAAHAWSSDDAAVAIVADDTVLIQGALQTLNGGEGPPNGTNPEANNTSPGTSGTGTDGNSRTSSNLNNDGTVESGFSEGTRSPLSSSTLATAAGIAAAAGLGLSGVGARLGTALLRFLSSTGAGLFLIGLFRRDRRPGAPENFMIFSSGQITNLVWTAPTAGKAPERYIVEGSVNGYWREVFEFGTNVCRAGVPTSEIESICNWRLRAANEHGVGKPSNEAILEAGTAEATTDLPMAA